MEPDFSGWATKANLKCTDGRTIMPDAFKHQDRMQVPLVWQHGHNNPENVLGHAILENRPEGVYTYGFFNNSPRAVHTKGLLEHRDINMLSIWANQLVERAKMVYHGAIREVSLVLSGANPGALIENVTIRHGDGVEIMLDDEVIIFTGIELELTHSADNSGSNNGDEMPETQETQSIQEVIDSLDDKQKEVLHMLVGEALEHGADAATTNSDQTIQDVYDSMTPIQQDVLHYMLGQALEQATGGTVAQDNMNNDNSANTGTDTTKEGNAMSHNVFEKTGDQTQAVISHDDMKVIFADANRRGSLKDAMSDYGLAHGIENIDVLFPDAKSIQDSPEWDKRRTEWVASLIGSARKSPFARIKTRSADITMDAARAKGYITGNMKKEEFFSVKGRTTTPTTIYKKQALDRDDVVDITDLDVVMWMKGEMRLMLDEEIGRAILIGDGRDISDEDKIDEQCIRPIASDHEMYTTTVNVNVNDASSSMNEVVDSVIATRFKYKGTGTPNFYTTEFWIAKFLTLRDGFGRRMYRNLDELATDLRVAQIIPVEVMLEQPDIIGIIVNPVDYVLGADKGGEVNMFDDFDIDYNKLKYLIETRFSGALAKLKSAIVYKSVAGTDTLVVPTPPTFDAETGALTIIDTAHVTYKHGATTVTNASSPYSVPAGTTWVIDATPAAGYYFGSSDDDQWSFTADA